MVFLIVSKITKGNTPLFIHFITEGSGCVKELLCQWNNDLSLTEEGEEFKAVSITLALPLKAWVKISGYDNDQQSTDLLVQSGLRRGRKASTEHIQSEAGLGLKNDLTPFLLLIWLEWPKTSFRGEREWWKGTNRMANMGFYSPPSTDSYQSDCWKNMLNWQKHCSLFLMLCIVLLGIVTNVEILFFTGT